MKIQLNARQRENLASRERDSFFGFCRRVGCDPDKLAALLLEIEKQAMRTYLDQLKETYSSAFESEREFYEQFLRVPDWWAYKRLQNRHNTKQYIGQIADCHEKLPINWAYLERLSSKLRIEQPNRDRSEWLVSFLEAIPYMVLSDPQFNAFVEHDTLIDEIPCIGVYGLLIPAVEGFLNVALRYVFEPTTPEKVCVLSPERAEEVGRKKEVAETLQIVIELVLARRAWIALEPKNAVTGSLPLLAPYYRFAAMGAREFVSLHEYGHLLMGHLEVGPCHDLEFEADVFAWEVGGVARDFFAKLGELSVLVSMMLTEEILRLKMSSTHPSAEDRIGRLLERADQEERGMLWLHLESMISLCRYVVQERFGGGRVELGVTGSLLR